MFFTSKRTCQKEFSDTVSAPYEPKQSDIYTQKSFSFKEYTITPLANFYINAKILSKKNYNNWLGNKEADLSPVDLALGWGEMSDDNVLKHINISQSGRWYRWKTKNSPIPLEEIKNNSANMHIIPLDDSILSTIDSACIGSTIELEGRLVNVTKENGWRWKSSLSRTDSGAGACEIIFVHHAKILD